MPSSKVRPAAPSKPRHLKSSNSIPTQRALAIRTNPKSSAARRNRGDGNDDAEPAEENQEEENNDNDNDNDSDGDDNSNNNAEEAQTAAVDPAPASVAGEPPKKKKPKLHPQEAIKKAWKVFDPEYLGKVTKILPDAVPTPSESKTKPSKSLNAAESYKQARTACEHAVKMIIAECLATNQKYTDFHFDLESDLKVTGRRDCLDGLSQPEDDRNFPSDVKRLTVCSVTCY